MKAYIQAIEQGSLQKEKVTEKTEFWYSQIFDLTITKNRIRFSFRWREWNYQIETKGIDGYYYSGIVTSHGFDDEEIDFNYYQNNEHHLLIGNWHEQNRAYQIFIEAHES